MDERGAYVAMLKALSDANRLMVFEMLSCCELCACDILEKFDITQPTLSHHMKILCGCGLVNARRHGKCMFYSLNSSAVNRFLAYFNSIVIKDCNCAAGCSCAHCKYPGEEVKPMADEKRTCTNPDCKCANCTCDPCYCTPENPCCCEGCDYKK